VLKESIANNRVKSNELSSQHKKFLLILVWCFAGGGALALLVAAINRKTSRTCRSYHIEINGKKKSLYIDPKQIINAIADNGDTKIAGRTIALTRRRMES
jgi:cell division protein FtsQ